MAIFLSYHMSNLNPYMQQQQNHPLELTADRATVAFHYILQANTL